MHGQQANVALGSVWTMNCKVVINTEACVNRFVPKFSDAQKYLDNEVLKDTEPYVPMRSGNLVRSGQRGTTLGSGRVIYAAPYARAQYYRYPRKSKDKHPQASQQWFEKSKAVNKEKWISGVNQNVTE